MKNKIEIIWKSKEGILFKEKGEEIFIPRINEQVTYSGKIYLVDMINHLLDKNQIIINLA